MQLFIPLANFLIQIPCSKWHHSTPLRLAKHGPQANQTTTATTRRTFVLPRTTTTATALPRRITNTSNSNKIILIQEQQQQQRQQPTLVQTNLCSLNETEDHETIAIQLKPSQRLLVITSAPTTGQPKIYQVRKQTQQSHQLQQSQQTQQQRQRKNISLQQLQRARSIAKQNRTAPASASAIRVPFLPGSPSTLPILKQSSPIKKNSNLVALTSPTVIGEPIPNNPNTITQLTQTQRQTPTVNTSTDTVYYTTVLDSTNLNQIQEQNKNSEIILTNSDNIIDNYTHLCAPSQQQQQQQSSHSSVQFTQTQPPRTLAAMAGIQLTGADEHMSPAFMSGATPTATVEEINVPVFIDEYLQQPAATHTEAANNINNYSQISSNSSNSSSSSNSNICHSISSGNGSNANNNIINGNGFVDFEFDMELFLDGSDVETFNNNNNNNNNKDNNSSNTSMSNNTLNNSGIDMADIDDTFLSCINNNSNYINNNNNSNTINNLLQQPINIKYENSENLSQFDLSNDLLMSTDISTAIDDFMPEWFECSEQAVNFNGLDYDTLLNNSQDPMLPCSSSTPSNSQHLSVNFNHLEPIVPKIEEHDEVPCEDENMFIEIATDMDIATPISIQSLSSLPSNSSRMQQKRLKLHLPSAPIADPLSTPTVLGGIVDLQVEQMAIGSTNYGETSINDIVEVLQDPRSHPLTYNEEDLPPTPHSYTSTSTYTNEYTPSSPAPSNISTNQQMNSNKKKRGRPAKTRSDQPDPSKLLKMPEAERKKLMDRAKNNEASRVSRRKNKLREEREIRLENELYEANILGHAELEKLNKIKDKLKRALKRGLSTNRLRNFN
ncbi:putative uncharacterized protein DDB_G0277255 [Bactrocera oleae]|uniref:putative uncharacterized protein DDB_G0277255 n=1 Tax=Bactrocera oleae TaxID=104688 RepID=UPI00387E4E72